MLVSGLLIVRCESPQLKGAMIYIQQSQWDKAKNLLLEAVDVNPQDAKAHFWLGRCYAQDGEFAKMNQHFEITKKITPKFNKDIDDARQYFYRQHFNRGINSFNASLNRQGENRDRLLNQAVEELKIALIIIKDDINSLVGLGTAYLQLGKNDEAVKVLQKAIEIDPKNKRALTNLGLYYYNEGVTENKTEYYKKAVDLFEKVLEIDPGDVKVIQRLALAYEKIGKTDKAIEAYDKAIASFPNNPDLYFNKAALLYEKGEKEEAIKLFNKVIEIAPDDQDALCNAGYTYIELENFKEALPLFERVVKLNPKNKKGWDGLVIVYTRLGMVKEANEALKKSKELEKNK